MKIAKYIVAILLFEILIIINTNCRYHTFRMFSRKCDDEVLSRKRAEIYANVNTVICFSVFPISLVLDGLFVEELPFTGNPVFDFVYNLCLVEFVIQALFTLFKIVPHTKMLDLRSRTINILNLLYPLFVWFQINLVLYSYQFLFEESIFLGLMMLILTGYGIIIITWKLAKAKFLRWPTNFR